MLYLKTDNREQLWIKFQFTNIVSSKKINESVISCEQCCRLKSLRGRWSPLSWEKELLNPLLKIGRKTDERLHFFFSSKHLTTSPQFAPYIYLWYFAVKDGLKVSQILWNFNLSSILLYCLTHTFSQPQVLRIEIGIILYLFKC